MCVCDCSLFGLRGSLTMPFLLFAAIWLSTWCWIWAGSYLILRQLFRSMRNETAQRAISNWHGCLCTLYTTDKARARNRVRLSRHIIYYAPPKNHLLSRLIALLLVGICSNTIQTLPEWIKALKPPNVFPSSDRAHKWASWGLPDWWSAPCVYVSRFSDDNHSEFHSDYTHARFIAICFIRFGGGFECAPALCLCLRSSPSHLYIYKYALSYPLLSQSTLTIPQSHTMRILYVYFHMYMEYNAMCTMLRNDTIVVACVGGSGPFASFGCLAVWFMFERHMTEQNLLLDGTSYCPMRYDLVQESCYVFLVLKPFYYYKQLLYITIFKMEWFLKHNCLVHLFCWCSLSENMWFWLAHQQISVRMCGVRTILTCRKTHDTRTHFLRTSHKRSVLPWTMNAIGFRQQMLPGLRSVTISRWRSRVPPVSRPSSSSECVNGGWVNGATGRLQSHAFAPHSQIHPLELSGHLSRRTGYPHVTLYHFPLAHPPKHQPRVNSHKQCMHTRFTCAHHTVEYLLNTRGSTNV